MPRVCAATSTRRWRRLARGGGQVYILGLLDWSAEEWEPFLGQRLHLPFAFLAPERARAVSSLALGATTPQGGAQNLWRVDP